MPGRRYIQPVESPNVENRVLVGVLACDPVGANTVDVEYDGSDPAAFIFTLLLHVRIKLRKNLYLTAARGYPNYIILTCNPPRFYPSERTMVSVYEHEIPAAPRIELALVLKHPKGWILNEEPTRPRPRPVLVVDSYDTLGHNIVVEDESLAERSKIKLIEEVAVMLGSEPGVLVYRGKRIYRIRRKGFFIVLNVYPTDGPVLIKKAHTEVSVCLDRRGILTNIVVVPFLDTISPYLTVKTIKDEFVDTYFREHPDSTSFAGILFTSKGAQFKVSATIPNRPLTCKHPLEGWVDVSTSIVVTPPVPPVPVDLITASQQKLLRTAPRCMRATILEETFKAVNSLAYVRASIIFRDGEGAAGAITRRFSSRTTSRVVPCKRKESLGEYVERFDDLDNLEICAVCLSDFKSNYNVTRLECHHVFHEDCISHWLAKCLSCPLCKAPVKPTSPSDPPTLYIPAMI